MLQSLETEWFIGKRKKGTTKVSGRLFLFPPAGGDVSSFSAWEKDVPDHLEICALKLPGRGKRIDEPLESNINRIADEAAKELKQMTDLPYYIFGHSMGALLAYEIVLRCMESGSRLPNKMIVSAMKPPYILARQNADDLVVKLYKLDDKEFKQNIIDMGGIEPIILEHDSFLNIILPKIRNDLKLCETYGNKNIIKLPVDLDIYHARDDHMVSTEQIQLWKDYTTKEACVHYFEGGHFYYQERKSEFLKVLSTSLNDAMSKA